MTYSISVAVAPLRKEPSDSSEMISQALFGEGVSVFELLEKWALVKLDADGYEGWVDRKQLIQRLSTEQIFLLTSPITLCTLSNGASVWLPAGARVGESKCTVENRSIWNGGAADIRLCAMQFLNAPYLWGGRTILGIDCSGLTQLVFQLNEKQLPRDAYQQAELGTTVSFLEETQTGDLAFFDNQDGRIIHVGIVLIDDHGVRTIVHASGKVRIDLIDHQGIYNRETGVYSHTLRIIKRMV